MSISKIANDISGQIYDMEKARSVLQAAMEEVDSFAKYKLIRHEHIMLLLHASDHILYEVLTELQQMEKALDDCSRKVGEVA